MSLADRTQALYDRIKFFPEGGKTTEGTVLKRDAYVAFLDLRQLLEREIIPALERMEKAQRNAPFWED